MTSRDEARRGAIGRLRAAGSATPVLDADLLLAHVLGARKEDVYAHPELALSEWAVRAYADVVDRRARGEPVAYLRGMKEFYGLSFVVDPHVLIPRPETEVLVGEAVRWGATRPGARICDVGTGCGAVAIAIATELPLARMIATDASEDALRVARENALRHDVADRVRFLHGDLLAPVRETDAIVANLPYLPSAALDAPGATSLAFEPRAALDGGADGLDVIRRAVAQLPGRLAQDGAAFFECAPDQAGMVADLLAGAVRARVRVVPDLSGHDRLVVAERR